MSESGAPLKNASGWFAAGVEVQRAATLLSDAAFKLFVWVCLHADRQSGILPAAANDLARVLGKTGDEVHCVLSARLRKSRRSSKMGSEQESDRPPGFIGFL
jgi:hypothetical protein